jgi:predicted HicB family RNase H-like nuclease
VNQRGAGGRPALPKGERRSKLLAFRVKPEEEKRIQVAAEAADLKVAAWVRQAVLRALKGGTEGRDVG